MKSAAHVKHKTLENYTSWDFVSKNMRLPICIIRIISILMNENKPMKYALFKI